MVAKKIFKVLLLIQWSLILADDATTTSSTVSPELIGNKTKREIYEVNYGYTYPYAANAGYTVTNVDPSQQQQHQVEAQQQQQQPTQTQTVYLQSAPSVTTSVEKPVVEPHAYDTPRTPQVFYPRTIYQIRPNLLNVIPNNYGKPLYGFERPPGGMIPPSIVTPVTQPPIRIPNPYIPPYIPQVPKQTPTPQYGFTPSQPVYRSAALTSYPKSDYTSQGIPQQYSQQYGALPSLPKPEPLVQYQQPSLSSYGINSIVESLPKPEALIQNYPSFKQLNYLSASPQIKPEAYGKVINFGYNSAVNHGVTPTQQSFINKYPLNLGKSTGDSAQKTQSYTSEFLTPQIFKNPVVPQMQHFLPQTKYDLGYLKDLKKVKIEIPSEALKKPKSSSEESEDDDDGKTRHVIKEEHKGSILHTEENKEDDGIDEEEDLHVNYENADEGFRKYSDKDDTKSKYVEDDFRPSKQYPFEDDDEDHKQNYEEQEEEHEPRQKQRQNSYNKSSKYNDDFPAKYESKGNSRNHQKDRSSSSERRPSIVKDSYGNYKRYPNERPHKSQRSRPSQYNRYDGRHDESQKVERYNINPVSAGDSAPKMNQKRVYHENWYITKQSNN